MKKKAAIIYQSETGNTKKLAEAIAKGMKKKLSVRMITIDKAKKSDVDHADIIGFGAGIYSFKPCAPVQKFVDSLPLENEKVVFTFSTSGWGSDMQLTPLKRELNRKGLCVVGSFTCKGHDMWGPFKWFGGINKGRPNKDDLKKAEKFGAEIAKTF